METVLFRPGVWNALADSLSRGKNPIVRGVTVHNSLVKETAPPILKELAKLLDPSLDIMREEKLLHHWEQYTDIIDCLFLVPYEGIRSSEKGPYPCC